MEMIKTTNQCLIIKEAKGAQFNGMFIPNAVGYIFVEPCAISKYLDIPLFFSRNLFLTPGMHFKKTFVMDQEYHAEFTVKRLLDQKNMALLNTILISPNRGKYLFGEAIIFARKIKRSQLG